MLETPRYGWSALTIGEWSDRISYLDDAAYMLLETLIKSYETEEPQTVEFDAEGWDWSLSFDGERATVITEKDELETIHLDMSKTEIAKALLADLRRDITPWADFVYEDLAEEELKAREDALRTLCDKLESLI